MMIERVKMINMTDKNNINKFIIGFIGLGLIGGSIAKTLRQHYPHVTIIGYEHGKTRNENVNLNLVINALEESQKGDRRHRSPHAAYSLGYYNGVIDSYK